MPTLYSLFSIFLRMLSTILGKRLSSFNCYGVSWKTVDWKTVGLETAGFFMPLSV
jgi:hypothetical protein